MNYIWNVIFFFSSLNPLFPDFSFVLNYLLCKSCICGNFFLGFLQVAFDADVMWRTCYLKTDIVQGFTGKRPRDLLNPKAAKYMQSVFSIKDAIGKKESREISALCGVRVSQVLFFQLGCDSSFLLLLLCICHCNNYYSEDKSHLGMLYCMQHRE